MKGNPLLRTAIVLTALLLLLWPVLRVTGRHAPPPPAPTSVQGTQAAATPGGLLRATLLLHAAPDAADCSVSQAGKVLLGTADRIAPGEYRAAVEISRGYDLVVKADWKEDEPHAVRLEVLVHGYQTPLEKSFWARDSLEDAFSLPESFLQPLTP